MPLSALVRELVVAVGACSVSVVSSDSAASSSSAVVSSVTGVSVSPVPSAGVSGSSAGTASVVTLIVVPSITLAAGRVYSPLSLAVTSDSAPSEVTALTEAIC